MRIISIISAFTLSYLGLLSAQPADSSKLHKDPLYQEAIGALHDHLPTIASEKFNFLLKAKLKSKSLSNEEHLELIFLLAESQIRANQPQEAIQSLSNKLITENPDAIFWKGQALAATGRYNYAIETLEKAKPTSKNYQLGLLKSANLAVALGDLERALNLLKLSIKTSKKVSPRTYLTLANLYLARQEHENAAETLTKTTPENLTQTRAKQIMLAQVDILQKKYALAISKLEAILSEENLEANTQSFTALRLAVAHHANGQSEIAISTLIKYLDKQPGQLISPMFSMLSQWLPNDTPITNPTITQLIDWAKLNKSTVEFSIPTNDSQSDLMTFAHFYHAKFLSNKPESTDKIKAIQEFENLRKRFPTHILSGSSLSLSASTLLTLGRVDEAKEILQSIQKLSTPIDPQAKLQASLLLGKLNLDDKNYTEAAKAYKAIESNDLEVKAAATMNAASSYLIANDIKGFSELQVSDQNPRLRQNLKLEHALWSARNKQLNARTDLHDFTLKHSDHPRINEAYLSLALHCLNVNPIDIGLANLITPKINQTILSQSQMVDFSYLKYRNAMTREDFAEAANIAGRFINRFPQDPKIPEFTLHQGLALYHNGLPNDARQLFNGMVKKYPKHPLKSYAKYYEAMSAKREGTPQSDEEAIKLLAVITQSKSALSSEARLQLVRLYVDTNQPKLAIEILSPIYKKQAKDSKDLQLSLILAEAYQNLASSDEIHFQSALDIYIDLTQQFKDDYQVVNEIKYNKARLLQHMGKDHDALAIYYSVVNVDIKKNPITEWKYYYKCGFGAITMLELMENPKAAIAIASKLIESKGERAQEAATKARDLEMRHMIWQE